MINIGNDPGTPASSTLSDIGSLVTVSDLPGLATLNILDAGDTASGAGTITASTVSGFDFGSGGSVAYAGGVVGGIIDLNVDGGTDGVTGVTYNVEGTASGTTTTINGGPNINFYALGAVNEDLDNLPGPVVINGGGAGDSVEVDDFLNTFDDNYTVTSTTVTSTGLFGGLTYGGLGAGGGLNLYASSGDNVIDVDSTADGVATDVSGQAGADTINVNGTGTGGDALCLHRRFHGRRQHGQRGRRQRAGQSRALAIPHHHHGQHRLDRRRRLDGRDPARSHRRTRLSFTS